MYKNITLLILCLLTLNIYSQNDSIIKLRINNNVHYFENYYKRPISLIHYNNHTDFGIRKNTYMNKIFDMKCYKYDAFPNFINHSNTFFYDYNRWGKIASYMYGQSSQNTLPGIGIINQASLIYQKNFNSYFDIKIGINAIKYHLSNLKQSGQSFGLLGSATYLPTEKLHISIFGCYTPNNIYNFNNSYYGTTIGYEFSERVGIEVGVQRYYDAQNGWKTVPIFIPYYKFEKFDLGIDIGGILYEIVRSIKDNKQQNKMLPIRLPPRN